MRIVLLYEDAEIDADYAPDRYEFGSFQNLTPFVVRSICGRTEEFVAMDRVRFMPEPGEDFNVIELTLSSAADVFRVSSGADVLIRPQQGSTAKITLRDQRAVDEIIATRNATAGGENNN